MRSQQNGKRNPFTLGIWITCLFMILAGCEYDNTTTGEEDGNPPEEPVVLRYTSFMLDSFVTGSAYYDAIAEFESNNPDIRIEVDYIQNVNYTAGLKMRLFGGEKLDVFDTWSPSQFEEFRKLDDQVYLDLTGSEFLEDFLPASLGPVTVDGKVYGVPGLMHTDALLYNKDILQSLELELPSTWEEFIQLCDALKSHGVTPVALNSEWWAPQFLIGSQMSNLGADAAWTDKLESGEIKVKDSLLVDAMRMTKELIDKGFVPEDWQQQMSEQSRDLVGEGKTAMMITGTWDLPGIIARNPKQEIGVMMVPGEGQTVPNLNIGSYKVISSSTQHPEEAKRFVAFMNGRVSQEKLASKLLAVPSVKNSQVDDPIVQQISELVTREDAVIYWPHTVSTESLQVSILELINEYLTGADLDSTLSRIQQAIDLAREDT